MFKLSKRFKLPTLLAVFLLAALLLTTLTLAQSDKPTPTETSFSTNTPPVTDSAVVNPLPLAEDDSVTANPTTQPVVVLADSPPDVPVSDGQSGTLISYIVLIAITSLLTVIAQTFITRKELAQSIPKEAYILMFQGLLGLTARTETTVDDNYLRQVMAGMGYNVQTDGSGQKVIVPTAVNRANASRG